MDRSDRTILVTGATGHQGGAAAKHLLGDGWHVRALVRDPDKPAARALAEMGAELVQGDLLDRASVDRAIAGAYGAYSVQTLQAGPEGELTESKNLVEAARAAGVQHYVYSSVTGAGEPSDLPWVKGKHEMECYLRESGLPFTILRPATFMENFLGQKEGLERGVVTRPEAPDDVHQWIAVDDIGRFIALAFLQPQTWLGTSTEIAGDQLTGIQVAAAFSMALGHPVHFEQQVPEGMPAPAPSQLRADIAKLRQHMPDLRTFAEWALEQHAAVTL